MQDDSPSSKSPHTSPSSTPCRRQYSSYTHLQKKAVVQLATEGTIVAAARKCGLTKSTVRGWMKIDFGEIEESRGCLGKMKRKKGAGRKLTYPARVDEELLAWVAHIPCKG